MNDAVEAILFTIDKSKSESLPTNRNCQAANTTIEQYKQKLRKIGNKCELCGKPPKFGSRLCLDHDHKSGKFRGLVCRSCNNLIGAFIKGLKPKKLSARFIEKYLSTR